jgi:hypothetical protein
MCARCALWAARRAGIRSALGQIRMRSLLPQLTRRRLDTAARAAIPILPSTDLVRTAAFYAPIGFVELKRYEEYLLLCSGGVELHFSHQDGGTPGTCFVHVGDAMKLWKQLRDLDIDGVGPIADQEHGLREFVITDPDGNRVGVGSPAH